MSVLTVLGLQLCLLAFSLGADFAHEWSVSDSDGEVAPFYETGYGDVYQAENPELGLEMEYHQAPQDSDIMLMKQRVRRSEKKRKRRPGTKSLLGNTWQSEDGTTARNAFQSKPHQGLRSPIGNTAGPEVIRAKREPKKRKNQPPKRPNPGEWSPVGRITIQDKNIEPEPEPNPQPQGV